MTKNKKSCGSISTQQQLLLYLVALLLGGERQHLQAASGRAGAAAAGRHGGLMLRDEVPHVAVEGAADERDSAADGVHGRDGVPEDHPRHQHRHGHLEVAGHVERHGRRRVDHVEDGEVEAEGQHPRRDDDRQRWPHGLVRVEPAHHAAALQHHGWH